MDHLWTDSHNIEEPDSIVKCTEPENVDIFRKEYPPHVLNVSEGFKEIYAYPAQWRSILFKRKISCQRFKKLAHLNKLSEQSIILHAKNINVIRYDNKG